MPDTPEEIDELIDTIAAGPKSVTVDGRSAASQDIKDLIELERFRSEQAAAGSSTRFGVRFFNTKPPGAV